MLVETLSEADQAKLTEWTRVAFDEAVAAGYIVPPWRPSAEAYQTCMATSKPARRPPMPRKRCLRRGTDQDP